jgi:hypothetical protein
MLGAWRKMQANDAALSGIRKNRGPESAHHWFDISEKIQSILFLPI